MADMVGLIHVITCGMACDMLFHCVTFTSTGAERLTPAQVFTAIAWSLMFIRKPVTTQYS